MILINSLFCINTIFFRAILDTVQKFFSSNANRKMLREAIYDLKLVKLVLPDVN